MGQGGFAHIANHRSFARCSGQHARTYVLSQGTNPSDNMTYVCLIQFVSPALASYSSISRKIVLAVLTWKGFLSASAPQHVVMTQTPSSPKQ